MKNLKKNRKGFTLIEFLAAFAIISVLATMAIETFISARKKSRSAVCLSNLREIGVAWQLYLNDHNAFPAESDILVGGDPTILYGGKKGSQTLDADERPLNVYIIDNVRAGMEIPNFHCPNDTEPTIFSQTVYDELGTTYVANLFSTNWNSLGGRKVHSILSGHSRIILTGEIGWLLQAQSDSSNVSFHSRKGASIYNVVFLDMHVDSITVSSGQTSGSNWQADVPL